jgi:quercetin dioxygenase-like cupin family protein
MTEDYTSKILELDNFVEYNDGAVVSKTLIKKTAGTVTIFAFDKDQALSTHSAPYDALVQVLDGTVQIEISGKKYDLKKGQSIILPANEPHGLKAISKFKMILTMIKSQT